MDSLELVTTAAGVELDAYLISVYVFVDTNSPNQTWTMLACSADGSKVVACAEDGYIYTSPDYGETWLQRTTAGLRAWRAVACSSDASKIIAGDTAGYLYTSADNGATWTQRTSAGSRYWFAVASSADGTKLAAGVASGGYIYTSADSGQTWTQQTAAGSRSWANIRSSADGVTLAAVVDGGYIYTSADSGQTWIERTSAGARSWWDIAFSSNCMDFIASVAWGGHIYVSNDGANSWAEIASATVLGSHSVAMSADGNLLVAKNSATSMSVSNGVTWMTCDDASDSYVLAASVDADIVYTSNSGLIYKGEIVRGFVDFLYGGLSLRNYLDTAWPELSADFHELNTYQTAFISDLAWPDLSGSITVGDSYSASLPVSGEGVGLLATLDSATLSFTVAPVDLQATLFMGFVVELSTVSAAAGLVGALDLPVAFSGTLVSCGVALDATLSIGTAFSFVATANPVTLSASYLLGSLFSADLVAAGVRLNSGSLVTDLVFAGSLVSAMPWLSADLRIDGGGSVEVWLVNAKTRGMAQYSNYPFQAFAMLGNGLLLAGAADGLYLMDSTTDAGKEIAGTIEVGTSDMGAAVVKYVPDAVLDCEGSGDLVLSVISDGGTIKGYNASIDHQGLQQNKRFKLAKGIKSRYWSARLSLPIGVSITSLELKPAATRRTA